ncbi:MAG: spermidine/putrescine transport system permease protein, partial [Actinomycetota bacterium]|nr:spermidine/putrescine transport system permease protein [Actinomycetota bacterium]
MSVVAPPEIPPSAPPAPASPDPPRHRRTLPDWVKGNLLLLPASVWFAFLLVIPLLIIVEYSLGKRGVIDPVHFTWSHLRFANYKDALDPDRLPIFVRSIEYAAISTFACVLLGFPLAYWIARFGGRFRNVYLVLVVIPFLTSYLIRIYAWQVILQDN